MHLVQTLGFMLGCGLLLSSCGNVDKDTDDETDKNDAGLSDGGVSDSGMSDAKGGDAGDLSILPSNACGALELDLHVGSGQALVTLASLSVTNEDITAYDFAMVNQMPEPPAIFLGPSVTALNLGNEQSFDAVLDAPLDGYAADGDEPVIGTGWRSGGNGTDGHEMTGNVYILKTLDGRYGKIRVTSAKQGIATIDAYFQADGSSSLACVPHQ